MKRSHVLMAVLASMQLISCGALLAYPGSFYQIMMRYKNRNSPSRNTRTAPSPKQLWAILDPPASLGSLKDVPIDSVRIARKADIDPNVDYDYLLRTDSPAEEETVAPTEAPEEGVTCGGDVETLLSTGEVREDRLLINTILTTPGYGTEGYPADLECIWNINPGEDCEQGYLTWKVLDGDIRSTKGCSGDYLAMAFNGVVRQKMCEGLSGESGASLWTTLPGHSLNMHFVAQPRGESEGGGNGVRVEISGYCIKYSDAYMEAAAEMATEAVTETATESFRDDLLYSDTGLEYADNF